MALAECCLQSGLGAAVSPPAALAADLRGALFGEAPGGFVVSGASEQLQRLAARTPLSVIGTVGGEELEIGAGDGGAEAIRVPLADLFAAHSGGLAGCFP